LRAGPQAAKIEAMSEPVALPAVRIWDLPTRLFHWMLAAAVLGAAGTAWVGGNAMVWHMRCGLTVMALLLFRVIWGLLGGRWSRFVSFIYSPATLMRYLRGEVRPGDHFEAGHSPLGALSVFGLLGVLAVQVATGLVADDEIAFRGPLNRFVSTARGLAATGWHADIGWWILLALVVLHIAAIVFYRVRKQTDLIRPMLSGDKPIPPAAADTPPSEDSVRTRAVAAVLGLACAGLAVWVARLAN
jgi:cytochrome b